VPICPISGLFSEHHESLSGFAADNETRPRRSERHMNFSMHLLLTLTTVGCTEMAEPGDADQLADVVDAARQRLLQLVEDFKNQTLAPLRTQQFEQQLQGAVCVWSC
jgi:hypothetical protein